MSIAERLAPLAFCTLAAGGCLVTFDDYPVREDAGAAGARDGSSGSAGTADSGISGTGTGGTGIGGTATGGVGGTGTGGTLPDGSATGGSATGGSSGAVGTSGTGGGCANTASDPENCGRCGHDCCGGDCVNGKCQPKEIYDGADGPAFRITVGAGSVFFGGPAGSGTEPASLRTLPLNGGVSSPLVWNKKSVDAIAADDTHVFVAGVDASLTDTGLVQRMTISGADPIEIASGENAPSNIVLYGDYVYWRSANNQIYRRVKDAGAAIQPIGPEVPGLGSRFVVNGDVLFFFSTTASSISRTPLAGGQVTPIAALQMGISGLAVNQNHVFWPITAENEVRRSAHDGADLVALVTNQPLPIFVAADDSYVYWITNGGALRAARADGSPNDPVIPLASGLAPRDFVLHGSCIYVLATGAPGRILRIAKP